MVDCKKWNVLYYTAYYQDREENITILLKAGIEINSPNIYDFIPLFQAVVSNYIANIIILLDYKTNINYLNNDEDSALY